MKPEQLEAIRNRADKATSGGWYVNSSDYPYDKNSKLVTNSHVYITKVFAGEADAEFIAYAREDIPALLAEVDKLKSQVDELIGTIYEYADAGTALMDLAEVIDNANEEIR